MTKLKYLFVIALAIAMAYATTGLGFWLTGLAHLSIFLVCAISMCVIYADSVNWGQVEIKGDEEDLPL